MTIANPDRPLRVIQWGTGNAGRPALRAIIRRPDLELVGVHAHSPDKIGRDAADLCGLDEPTGIIATDDVDALLAGDADCVSYMVQGETRIRETMEELCRALAAGKNVVNTSLVFLVYPPFVDPGMRKVLDDACSAGGSTLLTSGFDPGWSGDILPLALACVCERVDSIRVTEMMDYSTYEDPEFTGVFFGFGRPMDYTAPLFAPGAVTGGWGGMVHMVADALGWEIESLRETTDRLPAPETFETAMGSIERGTCAAVRFELEGIVDGRTAVTAAHVNRLREDIGAEWPSLSGNRSGYRIEVQGSPSYTCEIEPRGDGGDHNEAGILGTAMRMVNAIPAVCAAPPGLVTPLDLPIFTALGR
ncbi:MAG: dihydrodipicolinate reductase [Acidimicrobiia bacterium]